MNTMDPPTWGTTDRLMPAYPQQTHMPAPSLDRRQQPHQPRVSGSLSAAIQAQIVSGSGGGNMPSFPEGGPGATTNAGWTQAAPDGILCTGSHESDMTSDSCAGEALLARRRKLEESVSLNQTASLGRTGSKLTKVRTSKAKAAKKSATQRLEVRPPSTAALQVTCWDLFGPCRIKLVWTVTACQKR